MEYPNLVLKRRRLMWILTLRLIRRLWEDFAPIVEAEGFTLSHDEIVLIIAVDQADLAGSPHNIASLAKLYGKSRATTMRWVEKFEQVGMFSTTRERTSRVVRFSLEFRKKHGHLADEAINQGMPLIKQLSISD